MGSEAAQFEIPVVAFDLKANHPKGHCGPGHARQLIENIWFHSLSLADNLSSQVRDDAATESFSAICDSRTEDFSA
jgi:hypothetical protein